MTGCGELTITSCAPTAGADQNRSRLALALGAGSRPLPRASVGRQRRVQVRHDAHASSPACSGAPPSGRTAYTSGGVRSSWPSANGSASAVELGRRGVALSPPPGSPGARPGDDRALAGQRVDPQLGHPAEQLLHRDVLDPRLGEHPAARPVAGQLVELARVGLGVEHEPARRRRRGSRRRPARSSAVAIPRRRACGSHREPAELRRRADDQQPAGAEQLARRRPRRGGSPRGRGRRAPRARARPARRRRHRGAARAPRAISDSVAHPANLVGRDSGHPSA